MTATPASSVGRVRRAGRCEPWTEAWVEVGVDVPAQANNSVQDLVEAARIASVPIDA